MSEQDAGVLWQMIMNNFTSWNEIPEIEPDETDLELIKESAEDPQCHEFVTAPEAMKMLEL